MLEETYLSIYGHLVWCHWAQWLLRYGYFCRCHSTNLRNFQRLEIADGEQVELGVWEFNICQGRCIC